MPLTRRRVLSRSSVALAGVLLSGHVSGVSGSRLDTVGAQSTVDDEMVGELSEHVTAFGLDLHRQLIAEDDQENLLVSPYSASIALAMTWAGALGETADEMADTLRFPFEQETLHPTFGELNARVDPLKSAANEAETGGGEDGEDGSGNDGGEDDGEEFQLEPVNSLWGQEDFPFSEAFLDVLETHYGAGMNEVDYAADHEAAREQINDWVADQTEDRIEDLLPRGSIDGLTRLVLTNAVYFAASWRTPFEEEETEDATFTALDGSTATVPTMHQTETVPYAEVDGTQVLSLPYVGEDVDMVVVVPPDGEFETVEESLDLATVRTYFDALEPTYGNVGLPRFSYESSFALSETLQALGMEAAFNSREANFDGMVAEDASIDHMLHIYDVHQKTFIDVDEVGTEAAAATAVVVGDESEPTPEFDLTVDRPFLYTIRHRETNTALFFGRVVRLEGEEDSSESPEPVAESPPTDPDDDGLYQDVTGDGEVGTDDVVTFFENLETSVVTENAEYYDFDGSGDVGTSDVIALFESL